MASAQQIFGLESSYPQHSLTQITTINQNRHNHVEINKSSPLDPHDPKNNPFLLPNKRDYNKQYFHVYRSRLFKCRDFFQNQIQIILDEEYRNGEIGSPEVPIWTNLPEAKPGQRCVVIGISYKNMEKRPSALDNVGPIHQKADTSIWKLQGLGVGNSINSSGSMNKNNTTTGPTEALSPTTNMALETADKIDLLTRTSTTILQNPQNDPIIAIPQEAAFYNDRNYCNELDIVFLEDENGRVPLLFTPSSKIFSTFSPNLLGNPGNHGIASIPHNITQSLLNSPTFSYLNRPIVPHDLVSGIIMGVEGELNELSGEFEVFRIFFPSFHFEPLPSPSGPSVIRPTRINSNPSSMMIDTDEEPVASTTTTTTTTMNDNTQESLLSYVPQTLPTDTYIAFVSGINLATLQGPVTPFSRGLRTINSLLLEFLTGSISNNPIESADSTSVASFSKNITDVIIAGDLIGTTPPDALLPESRAGKRVPVVYTSDKALAQPPTMRLADHFLTKLSSSLNVYLLPGIHDPTNYTLPQQPFRTFLFPSASTYKNFHLLTNPIQLTLPISTPIQSQTVSNVYYPKSITILGSDGINTNNITKHSSHSSMSSLALLAQAQHMAPTAPDTLGLYPYQDQDPFAFHQDKSNLEQSQYFQQPDVLFSGNCPHFQTSRVKISTVATLNQNQIQINNNNTHSTRNNSQGTCNIVDLLCIPNFSTTGSFVLMNTRTKQCIPIYLNQDSNVETLDGLQTMLYKMNLNVTDEQHASIEFGDDEEPGEGME